MSAIWPAVVSSGKFEPSIDLRALSHEQKQILWTHLKANYPELAAGLTLASGDKGFLKMMSEFDGEVILETRYFPALLRNKVLGEGENNLEIGVAGSGSHEIL
ncbi:hypothetical protein DOK_11891 [gamma proteobacterium BDW918]|nr:hypothetical protein DOK_11891 [gamma proteobacterium BDW918]